MSICISATQLHHTVTLGAVVHGGSDEPSHDIGDLKDALEIVLSKLTPAQLQDLSKDPRLLGIATGIGPNDPSEHLGLLYGSFDRKALEGLNGPAFCAKLAEELFEKP